MPRRITDLDAHRVVFARGEREAVVLTDAEIHRHKPHAGGVAAAARFKRSVDEFRDLLPVFAHERFRLLPALRLGQHRAELREHRVAHGEFFRLIFFGVGVCEDVQAKRVAAHFAAGLGE